MIPVFQTITQHDPASGRYGDCYRACVASLFELPAEEVPHFADELVFPEGFIAALQSWLHARDMAAISFQMDADGLKDMGEVSRANKVDAFHLIGGLSDTPSRSKHICVAQYCVIVHDPWPKLDAPQRGRLLPDDDGTFDVIMFVKRFHPERTDHALRAFLDIDAAG